MPQVSTPEEIITNAQASAGTGNFVSFKCISENCIMEAVKVKAADEESVTFEGFGIVGEKKVPVEDIEYFQS